MNPIYPLFSHSLPVMTLIILGLGAPAYADDRPVAATAIVAEKQVASLPVTEPTPLASDELDLISAGESTTVNVLSNQQLTANNSGNSVTAGTVSSGDISFSSNALSGYNGVGNFVMNTGNNNNLQGSISINIATTPVMP